MSMSPSLVLTPLSSYQAFYDGGTRARAYLRNYGVTTETYGAYTLAAHYENDRVLLYQGKTWDNTLNADSYWNRHAVSYMYVWLDPSYWAEDRQVLMVLDVETVSGPQPVQVFVGNNLVREEVIDGRENIAILFDFAEIARIFVRPKNSSEAMLFYKASIFVI